MVAVVVGGVGFCVWRFFRKRRITKEQVPLARLEIMKKKTMRTITTMRMVRMLMIR